MNNMETQNINIQDSWSANYNALLSKHDYRGLADFLKNTQFGDSKTRRQAHSLISKFEEQADLEDKLLENADDRVKQSYNFMTHGPNKNDYTRQDGSIDENHPSYKFMQAWNRMADDKGNISIQFPNEDTYNKFVSSVPNANKLFNLGKNYTVSFNSDIENKVEIAKAIKDSNVIPYLKGILDTAVRNRTIQYSYVAGDKYNADKQYNEASNEYYKFKDWKDINSIIESSVSDYENLLADKTQYLMPMITTGYMGEDERRLVDRFAKGAMDKQTFDTIRGLLKEQYDRVIQTTDLTQLDVFAVDEENEGSNVLMKIEDNIARRELTDELNLAMADGRVTYAHASNGIDIGTMITITPTKDKDGKAKGRPKRFFVKDLFKSEAENELRSRSEVAAQMDYAKHQTYGHIKHLANGGTLTDWDGASDTAVYTDNLGNKEIKGKDEILDLLDVDAISNRVINYYLDANVTNNRGEGYTDEYYSVYGDGGFDKNVLYNDIKAKCTAIATEKYMGQSPQYIKIKTQELIGSILSNIGVKFDIDDGLNEESNKSMLDYIFSDYNTAR